MVFCARSPARPPGKRCGSYTTQMAAPPMPGAFTRLVNGFRLVDGSRVGRLVATEVTARRRAAAARSEQAER
jgi:hypothetical protein